MTFCSSPIYVLTRQMGLLVSECVSLIASFPVSSFAHWSYLLDFFKLYQLWSLKPVYSSLCCSAFSSLRLPLFLCVLISLVSCYPHFPLQMQIECIGHVFFALSVLRLLLDFHPLILNSKIGILFIFFFPWFVSCQNSLSSVTIFAVWLFLTVLPSHLTTSYAPSYVSSCPTGWHCCICTNLATAPHTVWPECWTAVCLF